MEPAKEAPAYKTAPEDRVPLVRKLFFSAGVIPDPLVIGTVGNFLVLFYNGVLGIPGKWVGTLLIAPRLWDAVTDPWFGKMSDNFRSRWGRRRPFILFGGIATAIAYALLWCPPASAETDVAKLVYLAVTGILFFTAYTAYFVPYGALCIELTPDYRERTLLMAFRNFFYNGGQMVVLTMSWCAATAAETFGKGLRFGYGAVAIAIACVCVVFYLVCFLGTRERPAAEVAATMPLWVSMKTTLRNRLFLRLAAAMFSLVCAIMTLASYVAYLFMFYLDRTDLLAMMGVFGGLVGIASCWAWVPISDRFNKPNALLAAMATVALASLSTLVLFNKELPFLVFVYAVVNAFGFTGVMVVAPSIMADITDLDELATGQRREGSYNGVFGFIFKLAVAGSLPILGWGVDLVGFNPDLGVNQTPETFLKLRLATAFIAVFFAAAAGLFLWRFPLTREKALEVRRALEERRGKVTAIH